MQDDSSRRQWLGMALAGGVVALAGVARLWLKPAKGPAEGRSWPVVSSTIGPAASNGTSSAAPRSKDS